MTPRLVAVALLLASPVAVGRCVPYAATLAKITVQECEALPASSPAASEVLITGEVHDPALVQLGDGPGGIVPTRPTLTAGTKRLLAIASPKVQCPHQLPATLWVIAYPRCSESNRSAPSYQRVTIESAPERWHPLRSGNDG
jgi:hypothetical protein